MALSDYWLEQKKDFAQAAKYAKTAIALGEPPDAHYALAKVYKAQGQWQNALNECQKELELCYKRDPRPLEPPTGLLFEVAWLKQKLAKQETSPSQKSRRQ